MKTLALLIIALIASCAPVLAQNDKGPEFSRTVNSVTLTNRTLNGFRFATGIVIR
jgi:hypothetical protein